MKKVALAGFFLVLVALGIAYNRAHDPAPSSASAVGASGLSWVTMRSRWVATPESMRYCTPVSRDSFRALE